MEKAVVLILMTTCLIAYEVKSINGNPPTYEDYKNTICDNDTFKCPLPGECCQKDPNVTCDNDTFKCESVDCCQQNSQECKKQYDTFFSCTTVKPQVESSSTVTEIKLPTTGPTQQEKEQVTPSSAKYHGEPQDEQSSTVAETNPTTMVPTRDSVLLMSLVPTQQQQKEQQTPSSELSSFKEEHCVWQSMLGCALTLIVCVVFAHKTLWVRDKCRQILRSVFGECQGSYTICQCKILSTSSPGTSGDNHEESDRESENNDTSGPQGQQEDKACINPESGSELREDVTEDTSLENKASRRNLKMLQWQQQQPS